MPSAVISPVIVMPVMAGDAFALEMSTVSRQNSSPYQLSLHEKTSPAYALSILIHVFCGPSPWRQPPRMKLGSVVTTRNTPAGSAMHVGVPAFKELLDWLIALIKLA